MLEKTIAKELEKNCMLLNRIEIGNAFLAFSNAIKEDLLKIAHDNGIERWERRVLTEQELLDYFEGR